MTNTYDAAVVGLGVMGSAAAWQLAKRGLRVIGLEQFDGRHDRGSSHGRTRVIRQATFEHPDYVPLALRSYELWRTLEEETGQTLLVKTGCLVMGPESNSLIAGCLASVKQHRLPHRLLSNAEVRQNYPMLTVRPKDVAVYEEEGGVLLAEECIGGLQVRAARAGAELRFGTKVDFNHPSFPSDGPFEIRVGQRTIHANSLVLAVGPWIGTVGPWIGSSLGPTSTSFPVIVERILVYWFDPPRGGPSFQPGTFPVFIWDYDGQPFYALPPLAGDGVKVSFHHSREPIDPDSVRREVTQEEIARMRQRLAETVPSLSKQPCRAATCLYTTTPDEHFVIGAVPGHPKVILASPCSGHGFKFAPVVGEIVADLVAEGRTPQHIALFAPSRFAPSGAGL